MFGSGASKIACEKVMSISYFRATWRPFKLPYSSAIVLFGFIIHYNKGIHEVRISIAIDQHITGVAYAIDKDIPPLIGLQDLIREHLLIYYLKNELWDITWGHSMPITYENGRIVITWDQDIVYFTRNELWRLRCSFLQSSANKITNLFHSVYSDETNESIKWRFKHIVLSYECFHNHSPAPTRRRAVITSGNLIFNLESFMNILWTEGVFIIYNVDTHKGFHNATFLRGKKPLGIWTSIVVYWAIVYCNYLKP